MSLEKFLSDKRSHIIKKWRDVIIETYPGDTQRFLRKEKDPFANPVGYSIRNEIGGLFDELIKGETIDKISASLDHIIRVRAVQDFRPSDAIGFVLQLKKVIRKELEDKDLMNGFSSDFHTLEQRIDEIALLAFDIYSKCRQEIYEIRVKEVKNHLGKLLKQANLTIEIPDEKPDI